MRGCTVLIVSLALLTASVSTGCTSAKGGWDSASKLDGWPTRDRVNDASPAPGLEPLPRPLEAWVVTDDAGVNHLHWNPSQQVGVVGGPIFFFFRSDTPIHPGDTMTASLFAAILWDPPTALDMLPGPGYYAGQVSYATNSADEELKSNWVFFQVK